LISPEKQKVLDLFDQGRREYKLMNFEQAKTIFAQALQVDPEDGPSKIYFQRCKHYMENPPSEDWDGVFVMKTK